MLRAYANMHYLMLKPSYDTSAYCVSTGQTISPSEDWSNPSCDTYAPVPFCTKLLQVQLHTYIERQIYREFEKECPYKLAYIYAHRP